MAYILTNRKNLKDKGIGNVIEIIKAREQEAYEIGFSNGLKQGRREMEDVYNELKKEFKQFKNNIKIK